MAGKVKMSRNMKKASSATRKQRYVIYRTAMIRETNKVKRIARSNGAARAKQYWNTFIRTGERAIV